MIRLTAFLVLFCACAAQAQPVSDVQRDLYLSFAQAVSKNDADVMQRVQGLIATPPTTVETIGFYGYTDAPAPERALRGMISVLADTDYLVTVEDKYTYEFSSMLVQRGLADLDGTTDDFDILSAFTSTDDDFYDDAFWQDFRSNFPSHVNEIEAAVARQGKQLLSLRMPQGDTLFFWVAEPEIAAQWLDRGLYVGLNTLSHPRTLAATYGVTGPDWQNYWSAITYGLLIPEGFSSVPDGL